MAIKPRDLLPDELDYYSKLEQTQAEVWLLLHYAVSDSNKDISKDHGEILHKVIPALRKKPRDLTDMEAANLLEAYNALSQIVYPASYDSLWLKTELEQDDRQRVVELQKCRSLWQRLKSLCNGSFASKRIEKLGYGKIVTVGIWVLAPLFFIIQSYTFYLSDTLDSLEQQKSALATLNRDIGNARSAVIVAHSNSPAKLDGGAQVMDNIDEFPPISDFIKQRRALLHALELGYCMLLKPDFVMDWVFPGARKVCAIDPFIRRHNTPEAVTPPAASAPAEADAVAESGMDVTPREIVSPRRRVTEMIDDYLECAECAARDSVIMAAESLLKILNYLLLPTLLGFIGSLAYVIRGLLWNFDHASFVVGNSRKGKMRLVLGPLLSLVSGIILAPESTGFSEASFSPLILGFLMGYSVEFAFKLFDTLIEKGKSLLPDLMAEPRTDADSKEGLHPPVVIRIDPNHGDASGGATVSIQGSGFTPDAKVYFGRQAASIQKIQDSQITVTSPPGKDSVYLTVATAAGPSLSKPETLYTYLTGGEAPDADGEGPAACDPTVAPVQETEDEDLPPATGGVEPAVEPAKEN